MAGDLSGKKSNYISRVQQATDTLLAQVNLLEALTLEGVQLGYVAPLGGQAMAPLTDADFQGANSFLDGAVFANVLATLQSLDQSLHANGGAILTSLYQMRK